MCKLIKIHQKVNLFHVIIAVSIFCSCSDRSFEKITEPVKVSKNKIEAEEFLAKYKTDSLGRKSFEFLLKNLSSHLDDSVNVTGEFLDSRIQSALAPARSRILSGDLSFSDFCEFVLPYRIDEEPLENWMSSITRNYKNLFDSILKTCKEDRDVASKLNDTLRQGFVFADVASGGSQQAWSKLIQEKKGGCSEMSRTIAYPLRTLGIACTLDYTPFWGNIDGSGHEWNCLITSRGEISFMGLESNPDGRYSPQNLILQPDASKSTFRLAPKVFRKTFSVNKLIKNNDPLAPYPQHFADVTDKYCKVGEITICTDADDFVFSYVCVYNKKTWHPVDFGTINMGRMAFKNLAVNLLYLPCVFRDGQLIPASSPIILHENGDNILLEPAISAENIQINNLYSIPMEQLQVINEIGCSTNVFEKRPTTSLTMLNGLSQRMA